MFSLLLNELILYFYLPSMQLVLCSVAAVKRLPEHQPKCNLYFSFGPLRSAWIFWEIRNKWLVKTHILDSIFFYYLDPVLIYISFWIDCLFEIRKIAVCVLWLLFPGHYRVTDEALLAETMWHDPSSFLWIFSLFLKELMLDFLPSLQLVWCSVATVKHLPVHQP